MPPVSTIPTSCFLLSTFLFSIHPRARPTRCSIRTFPLPSFIPAIRMHLSFSMCLVYPLPCDSQTSHFNLLARLFHFPLLLYCFITCIASSIFLNIQFQNNPVGHRSALLRTTYSTQSLPPPLPASKPQFIMATILSFHHHNTHILRNIEEAPTTSPVIKTVPRTLCGFPSVVMKSPRSPSIHSIFP